MESVLVPRKLFSGPVLETPLLNRASPGQASYAAGAAFTPTPSAWRARPATPASQTSGKQATASPSTVIRYGVPSDPDAAPRSEQHSSQAIRYGTPEQDGYSSDDDDEGDFAAGSLGGPGRPLLSQLSPVEEMLQSLNLRWQAEVEIKSAERTSRLQAAFQAADEELTNKLAAIAEQLQAKQRELSRADEQQAAKQLQAREQRMKELQRSHDKAAAQQQEQVERLQRAAREEAQRAAQAAAAAKAAAEAAAAVQAAHAAEQAGKLKQQQEEAAKQAAQAQAAKDKEAAAAAAVAAAGPSTSAPTADKAAGKNAASRCMRATAQAVAWEQQLAKQVDEIKAGVQSLLDDDSLKKQRRDVEKKMTVHVQQISSTLDQIAKKCGDVYQLIAGQPSPAWQHYAMLMFATKWVKQWSLVMLNNQAAFALATVLVKVSTRFPALMALAVRLMHQECCFTVPCSFVAQDPGSGAALPPGQLRRLMGYQELDHPDKPGAKVFESDEEFVKRVEGIMMLYGAVVQVDEPHNPHGYDHGWHWLARFLNAIPASRVSAKALIYFLRAAGYALHNRYRGQFVKLLKCMYEEFLPELGKSTEPDVQAVRTLLEHYLVRGQYKQEPEGHSMPKIDMSSYQRA